MQCLQLRVDRRSTPVRLQFDNATTIRRSVLRPYGAVGIYLFISLFFIYLFLFI